MKRSLLLCMLAAVGTMAGYAKTVYFERPSGVTQSTTINKYAWTGENKFYGDWPGQAISGSTSTIDGKIYLVEEIADEAENLIFNWEGSGQTSDLKVVDNGVYNITGLIGTVVNGHFQTYESPKIRYYFENTDNWDKVYIHTWNPSAWGLGWPGKELTDTEELLNGKTYYYAEVPEDTPLKNMIFNNNNGSQTGDIVGSNVVPFGIYNPSGYTGMTKDDITAPFEGTQLYFLNDLNWKTVYAYAWSGDGDNVTHYNGAWPGNPIATTETVDGNEVLVANFPGAENIIFSCFDETHNHSEAYDWEKTRDLVYEPGMIYRASITVIDNKPEKLYVIGGGTGWNINSEDVVLTPDADDSYIYTGDVKVSGEEFRIYTNHDGDWDTGSYGSGAPENQYRDITFTKGLYSGKAEKGNKGNWKLPMGYKDKIVKFTFNYIDGTFTIFDPSVISVKELLHGEAPVAPAEGDYEDKQAFVEAGDNDGLATISIVLEAGVHINRACAEPAILYNDGKKVFEVSAMADPKEIMADKHIGVRCISGNSFDGGTDEPSTFQVVFSLEDEDVLVFKGENELRFPDGFFMLGGEREIKSVTVDDEVVEYESWTGGTSVKGGSFVWNVKNADRPAVTPITHNEGVEDAVKVETSGGLSVEIKKYGEHQHFAHFTVSEVYGDNELNRTLARGASSLSLLNTNPGTLHKVTYHFHADNSEETVDKSNWVRDHNGQVCENTLYALTQPTGIVCDLGKNTLSMMAGKGTVILYTLDGSEPDVNLLQGIATQSENSTYVYKVEDNNPVIDLSENDMPENPEVKVVAAAANPETGEYVVNPVYQDIQTSVSSIEAAEGEAVYFNLQGVRVDNPADGVYIRVAGGKAMKVTVK
ncbi:MAG: starch-binding protein [Muribaculaceae bacterium]|nr:starch-binding protein [Muribaculaceae bacterium]